MSRLCIKRIERVKLKKVYGKKQDFDCSERRKAGQVEILADKLELIKKHSDFMGKKAEEVIENFKSIELTRCR